ncbi:MAG: ABC transporter permease subunit [Dehalococcoidia bacterium]|nr:ABC transporter permease subunit [Dehalococcoidia bacterium]
MRVIFSIARKELVIYFTSPVAYVVAGVFLALTGVFFIDSVDRPFAEAAMRGLLLNSAFFLMTLLPPILTMRLLAEEQKMGTLELLLTAPVRDYEVVIGKYLASLAILSVTVLFTLFYVAILFFYSAPDPGPIFSGYLGFLLYGSAALAVGLLASSLTANQIVAAVVAFGITLLFTVVDRVSTLLTGMVATILEQLSLTSHFDAFSRGVIATNDVTYYLILTFVFLFLATRALESRRWR